MTVPRGQIRQTTSPTLTDLAGVELLPAIPLTGYRQISLMVPTVNIAISCTCATTETNLSLLGADSVAAIGFRGIKESIRTIEQVIGACVTISDCCHTDANSNSE